VARQDERRSCVRVQRCESPLWKHGQAIGVWNGTQRQDPSEVLRIAVERDLRGHRHRVFGDFEQNALRRLVDGLPAAEESSASASLGRSAHPNQQGRAKARSKLRGVHGGPCVAKREPTPSPPTTATDSLYFQQLVFVATRRMSPLSGTQ